MLNFIQSNIILNVFTAAILGTVDLVYLLISKTRNGKFNDTVDILLALNACLFWIFPLYLANAAVSVVILGNKHEK